MNYELLTLASDEDFMAQAYSDYLAKKAENYSKIIGLATEAIADSTLDDNATLQSLLLQEKLELLRLINNAATAMGYDLKSMKADSLEYINLVNNIAANNNEVRSYVTSHYTSPDLILDNINAFVNSEYSVSYNDDETGRLKFLAFSNTPDLICYSTQARTAALNVTDSLLSGQSISGDAKVFLNGGYCTMRQFIASIVEDGLNTKADTSLKLQLVDIDGSNLPSIFNRTYSTKTVLEEMKTSLSSCFATAAAFASLKFENITDRVTNFTSMLRTKITDAYTAANDYIANIKMKVSDTTTHLREMLDYFMEETGWNHVLETIHESGTGWVDGESPFAQATGSTPTAAINTSTGLAVIGATFKSIIAVCANAFVACVDKVDEWVNGLSRKNDEAFYNPFDIGVLNEDSHSALVDRFSMDFHTTQTLSKGLSGEGYAECVAMAEANKDKWCKLSLIYGEVLFHITDVTRNGNTTTVGYDFKIKPRPIKRSLFYALIKSDHFKTTYCGMFNGTSMLNANAVYDYQDYRSLSTSADEGWIFKLVDPERWEDSSVGWQNAYDFAMDLTQGFRDNGDFYSTPVDSEDEFYASFALGSQLLRFILMVSAYKNMTTAGTLIFPLTFTVFYLAVFTEKFDDFQEGYVPNGTNNDPTTNLRWLQTFLGKETDSSDTSMISKTYYTKVAAVSDPKRFVTFDSSLFTLAAMCTWINFFCHWYDEATHPVDFEFMPYTSNTEGFSAPQYYLKTDAENNAYAGKVLGAIITVIVVAAMAIAIGVTVKRIRLNKMAKLSTWIGQKDAAAWEGKVMSASDMRKYLRKTRKLEKLQGVSSGLVGAQTVTSGLGEMSQSPFIQQLTNSATSDRVTTNDNFLPNDSEEQVSLAQRLDQLYFITNKAYFS